MSMIFAIMFGVGVVAVILTLIWVWSKQPKQKPKVKRTDMQKKLMEMAKTDLLASIKPEGSNASKIETIKALDELE